MGEKANREIAWCAQVWEPTCELRWLEAEHVQGVGPTLQQKWIERRSGDEEWREIPSVVEG